MKRLVPLLLALTACDFGFGDGDDTTCGDVPVVEGYPSHRLHDPYSNTCVEYGNYGTYCDPSCGPCPPQEPVAEPPPFGACESQCTGLAEGACLAAPGCQASYIDVDGGPAFDSCWAVAIGGPDVGGACEGRDALACAEDDSCAAYYAGGFHGGGLRDSLAPALTFVRCGTEPSMHGCDDIACEGGTHCEIQCAPDVSGDSPCAPACVPDNSACAAADCGPGYTCVDSCSGSTPTDGGALVPAMCQATCVPTGGGGDPGACSGPVSCFAAPPACPASTVPGIVDGCWSGYCIPEADCGPHDPGGCEPATCATPGPACPAGTVGGTVNGCWTGYCIPAASCPLAACEQLTTESACAARADCQAVYEGSACTCDPVCTCEELTFDHCSSGATPDPFDV